MVSIRPIGMVAAENFIRYKHKDSFRSSEVS